MKQFILKVSVIIFLFSAFIFSKGDLQGFVTDSISNSPLVGANLLLVGTSLGNATDIEGKYEINSIPAGIYKLRISYIGYQSKVFDIKIEDDKTLVKNIRLSAVVLEGQEVVVRGQALGQAAAINQQLTSNTIINVVSEEKIQELPDANAAESIGRLPGVSIIRSGGEANKVILRGLSEKFTNITIDGMQIGSTDSTDRSVDLSTISQSSLAGIELYKALTPDKDGDAIAGTVNLVTKRAPSERKFRLDLKGDYNQLMKSAKQYDFALRYGERFFNDFLGVQLFGNLENRIRSSENINLNYNQGLNNQTDYAISNFILQFDNEKRKRNGFSALFDLNTPDNGSIRFNNVYSSTKRDILTSTRDYPANTGGSQTGASVSYSAHDQTQEISTLNSSLLGDNTIYGLSLNWGLSFAQSKSDFPYDFLANFLEGSSSSGSTVVSGMQITPTIKTNPEVLVPYALNNFKAATLYDGFYTSQKSYDRQRTLFLNVLKDYSFGNFLSGQLKIGGKYKVQDKSLIRRRSYSPYYLGNWQPFQLASDGSIQQKNLSGTYFDSFYQYYLQSPSNRYVSFNDFLNTTPESREIFNLYNLNPLVNKDKLEQWYSLNKNGIDQTGKVPEYWYDPTAQTYDYSITERVGAGYLMNTLNIGPNLVFIAGARVESEDNDYESVYSPIQTGGFPIPPNANRDTTASHNETIVLPNLQLLIKPTDFINIRLAAYRALARPDFNYRLNSYFAWRDVAASGSPRLFAGNPLLKDAKAWNYEVNLSFYGNEIGLISVSAFYKDITDMFHILNGINTTNNSLFQYLGLKWKTLYQAGATYALTVPYNSDKPTKVWGFELEHQINFTSLPGFLSHFVLSYNASIVHSETHLIGTTIDTIYQTIPGFPFPIPKYVERVIDQKQQLENQPKFYGNIALGYDIDGFSARISVFHQSEYNISFTPSGRGDIVSNPFTRLDLSLKQKINENISALLNVNNLTNVKEGNSLYNRVNNYKILNLEQRYALTVDFGLQLTF